MLAAVAQSNYPRCVYTVPIRAVSWPVSTQGYVDTYSINTSSERFFISLDLKKKKKKKKKTQLMARNVALPRGFSFLSLSYKDAKHCGKQKPYSFYDSSSTMT